MNTTVLRSKKTMLLTAGVVVAIVCSNVFWEHFYFHENRGIGMISPPSHEVSTSFKDEEMPRLVPRMESMLPVAHETKVHLAHSYSEPKCADCESNSLRGDACKQKDHVTPEVKLTREETLLCQGFPFRDNMALQPVN